MDLALEVEGLSQKLIELLDRLAGLGPPLLGAIEKTKVSLEDAEFIPSEKACRWCDAAPICPAMHKMSLEAAAADFAAADMGEHIEAAALSEWLEKIPMLKNFVKSVEERSKSLMYEHRVPIKGYKIVEGRRIRTWSIDEGELEMQLSNEGYTESEFLTPGKMKSPAQMEKALPAFDVDKYTIKKPGSPTVAAESDKRPALIFSTPEEDFG